MDPRTGAGRCLRVATFGAVALTLSSVAHVLGGGSAPSAGALTIGLVPVTLAAVHLSRRRRGTRALLTTLALLQGGLHVVFHLASTAPVASGLATAGAHCATLGRFGDGASPLAATAVTDATPAATAAGATPLMLAGHLAAAAALAWLMARGEDVLWRVVTAWLVVLPGLVRIERSPRPVPTAPLATIRRGRRVCGSAGLRGPPQAVGA